MIPEWRQKYLKELEEKVRLQEDVKRLTQTIQHLTILLNENRQELREVQYKLAGKQ